MSINENSQTSTTLSGGTRASARGPKPIERFVANSATQDNSARRAAIDADRDQLVEAENIEIRLGNAAEGVYDENVHNDVQLERRDRNFDFTRNEDRRNLEKFAKLADSMVDILGKRVDEPSDVGLTRARREKEVVVEEVSRRLIRFLNYNLDGTQRSSPPLPNPPSLELCAELPSRINKLYRASKQKAASATFELKVLTGRKTDPSPEIMKLLDQQATATAEVASFIQANKGYTASNLLKEGKIKAAKLAVLGKGSLPVLDNQKWDKIKSKYPPALPHQYDTSFAESDITTSEGARRALCLVSSISAPEYRKRVLSRKTKGKKGGHSGFSPREHSVLVRSGLYDEALVGLHSLIALGWLNSEADSLLRTGRGIALGKNFNEDGVALDVRPICAIEPLLSTSDAMLLKLSQKKLQELAGVEQLGLSFNGCQALATIIQTRYDLVRDGSISNDNDQLYAFLSLDLLNAFNQVGRVAILELIRDELPELLPFYNMMFGSSYTVWYGDKEIQSHRGVGQGSPSSAALFDALMGVWLKAWISKCKEKGVEVLLCHDGAFLFGQISTLELCMRSLLEERESLTGGNACLPPGSQLQPLKSELFVIPPPDLSVVDTVTNFNQQGEYFVDNHWIIHGMEGQQGIIVAGIPVGSETYILDSLHGKLDTCVSDFSDTWRNLCKAHDPVGALSLSRACILPSISYITSVIPYSLYAPKAATCQENLCRVIYEEAMPDKDWCWISKRWIDLSESCQERIQARVSTRECNGGLGLSYFNFNPPAGNIALWRNIAPLVIRTVPPGLSELAYQEALAKSTRVRHLMNTATALLKELDDQDISFKKHHRDLIPEPTSPLKWSPRKLTSNCLLHYINQIHHLSATIGRRHPIASLVKHPRKDDVVYCSTEPLLTPAQQADSNVPLSRQQIHGTVVAQEAIHGGAPNSNRWAHTRFGQPADLIGSAARLAILLSIGVDFGASDEICPRCKKCIGSIIAHVDTCTPTKGFERNDAHLTHRHQAVVHSICRVGSKIPGVTIQSPKAPIAAFCAVSPHSLQTYEDQLNRFRNGEIATEPTDPSLMTSDLLIRIDGCVTSLIDVTVSGIHKKRCAPFPDNQKISELHAYALSGEEAKHKKHDLFEQTESSPELIGAGFDVAGGLTVTSRKQLTTNLVNHLPLESRDHEIGDNLARTFFINRIKQQLSMALRRFRCRRLCSVLGDIQTIRTQRYVDNAKRLTTFALLVASPHESEIAQPEPIPECSSGTIIGNACFDHSQTSSRALEQMRQKRVQDLLQEYKDAVERSKEEEEQAGMGAAHRECVKKWKDIEAAERLGATHLRAEVESILGGITTTIVHAANQVTGKRKRSKGISQSSPGNSPKRKRKARVYSRSTAAPSYSRPFNTFGADRAKRCPRLALMSSPADSCESSTNVHINSSINCSLGTHESGESGSAGSLELHVGLSGQSILGDDAGHSSLGR